MKATPGSVLSSTQVWGGRVLLFVGGNQGKEFALSVKGSGGEWIHNAPFRVDGFPPEPFVPALGHTCGPRWFVQDRLTAAVICRT